MALVKIPPAYQRTIAVENPIVRIDASDPLTADKRVHTFTRESVFVLQHRGVLIPQPASFPSATWNLRFAPTLDDVGTPLGADIFGGSTSFGNTRIANILIPANSYIWLDFVSASSGADYPAGIEVQLLGRSRQ